MERPFTQTPTLSRRQTLVKAIGLGAGAWLGGVGADGIGGYGHFGWRLNELPDSLALTADQQASITALVDAFTTANQADLDSLSAIRSAAEAAHAAGASRDSVHAILESGEAIRERTMRGRANDVARRKPARTLIVPRDNSASRRPISAMPVRSNPAAASAPASSGGNMLPIRPIPMTKPVPLARISAGKVRATTA